MRRIALFLAVLTFAALTPARADELIIPGKSIGPVLIDMSAQELYRALGDPRASDVGEDTTAYTYDGLQVGVDNDSQLVYRVFSTSPKYKLAKGIAVGSSALAAVAAYGEPDERDETENGDKTMCYGDFELYLKGGMVAAIMVSKGGCELGLPLLLPVTPLLLPVTAPADLQSLQGSWQVTALEIDGAPLPPSVFADAQIQLAGALFTSSGMGATYRGTMTLSEEDERKLFTLSFTDGPEAGRSNHGLYELDGDVWRFCLDMKGGAAPTRFSTSPGSGRALQTLARIA